MAKTKRAGKKPNRSSDMDQALFEALKTAVPQKDTGPDPDNILSGLFDDEDDDIEVTLDNIGESRSLVMEVDEADCAHGEKIIKLVQEQTGEQIELAEAIKIALMICPLEPKDVSKAYSAIRKRPGQANRI